MKKKNNSKELTPRQQKFFKEWSKEGFDLQKRFEAAVKAGYPLSNLPAHAANAIYAIGRNQEMVKSMEKHGITFDFLAKRLKKNLEAKAPMQLKDGKVLWYEDNFNQNKAFELSMKILDGFAPKRIDVDLQQYSRMDINIRDKTKERAKKATAEIDIVDVIPEEFNPD